MNLSFSKTDVMRGLDGLANLKDRVKAGINPEIANGFWRWREALFGTLMAVCGMLWAVGHSGMLAAVGMSISIVGAIIIFAGIQRTRFRTGSIGPGLVQVNDRMITFYGRNNGGSVSVDALEFVELDPVAKPAQWVMMEPGGQPLEIPTDAEGAEQLFDVIASLDGIKTENMLDKLRANPNERVLIWHETQRRLH